MYWLLEYVVDVKGRPYYMAYSETICAQDSIHRALRLHDVSKSEVSEHH